MNTSEGIPAGDGKIHICHLVFRLTYGGLENGLVNLVNRLDHGRYRHSVVCLTESGAFEERIDADADCRVIALGKPAQGTSLWVYWKVWRLLLRLRPDIVHTRNLPVVDLGLIARLALVPRLIHSEHGLDVIELSGTRRYVWLRRLLRPIVSRYIALGRDLKDWLVREAGVRPDAVEVIYNGVDVGRFRPADTDEKATLLERFPHGFRDDGAVIVGTVGRMAALKRPLHLVEAIGHVMADRPDVGSRLRLALIGDGEQRAAVEAAVKRLGLEDQVWISGFRDDVAELMRCLDIFVLPSLREGLSNTLLEAMATGLPVVATAVGGTPELVDDGVSGRLVSAEQSEEMAGALAELVDDAALRGHMGRQARHHACTRFSIAEMVHHYDSVYASVAGRGGGAKNSSVTS